MSARTDVAAYLKDALPTWQVVARADAGTITRPTALVYVTDIAPGPVQGSRSVTLSVDVIAPGQVTQDDNLEDLLEVALAALDECRIATWTRAVRSTYAETNPAYGVTVEATEMED